MILYIVMIMINDYNV